MNEYPFKALLVDDNPEYARMLVAELERAEPGKVYAVHTQSLQAALHLLSQDNFDIILLDLFLSSPEDLRRIHEQYADHSRQDSTAA